MSEDMIDRVIYDETVDALRISILQARELADRIAALEAEASEGERRGLERAAEVASRMCVRDAFRFEFGHDVAAAIRALIPEAPVREGE